MQPFPGKTKFPRSLAIGVARELVAALRHRTERVIIAGSLRRGKPEVGDVEIIYIPSFIQAADPSDLFGKKVAANHTDIILDGLIISGLLSKRLNKNGNTAWGGSNKLALHVATGIPVDLFSATTENWFNYLVCRTGGAETNISICNGAIAKGWKWNPYGEGFTRSSGPQRGTVKPMHGEREVFEFAGLDYIEPRDRK